MNHVNSIKFTIVAWLALWSMQCAAETYIFQYDASFTRPPDYCDTTGFDTIDVFQKNLVKNGWVAEKTQKTNYYTRTLSKGTIRVFIATSRSFCEKEYLSVWQRSKLVIDQELKNGPSQYTFQRVNLKPGDHLGTKCSRHPDRYWDDFIPDDNAECNTRDILQGKIIVCQSGKLDPLEIFVTDSAEECEWHSSRYDRLSILSSGPTPDILRPLKWTERLRIKARAFFGEIPIGESWKWTRLFYETQDDKGKYSTADTTFLVTDSLYEDESNEFRHLIVFWKVANTDLHPNSFNWQNKFLMDNNGAIYSPSAGVSSGELQPGTFTSLFLTTTYRIPSTVDLKNIFWGTHNDNEPTGLRFKISLDPHHIKECDGMINDGAEKCLGSTFWLPSNNTQIAH